MLLPLCNLVHGLCKKKNPKTSVLVVLLHVNFLGFFLKGQTIQLEKNVARIFIFEKVHCIIITITETICGKDGKYQKC